MHLAAFASNRFWFGHGNGSRSARQSLREEINHALTFLVRAPGRAMSAPWRDGTIPLVGVEVCCVTRPGGPGR